MYDFLSYEKKLVLIILPLSLVDFGFYSKVCKWTVVSLLGLGSKSEVPDLREKVTNSSNLLYFHMKKK